MTWRSDRYRRAAARRRPVPAITHGGGSFTVQMPLYTPRDFEQLEAWADSDDDGGIVEWLQSDPLAYIGFVRNPYIVSTETKRIHDALTAGGNQ